MSVGDEIQRDSADLRRSLRLTLWSYALRVATPFLLIVVIRLYGAAAFGVFAVVTGLLGLITRSTLMGLDKGLLWWLPRQSPARQRAGVAASLVVCTATAALASLAVVVALAPWIAGWAGRPDAVTTLRWMATSMVPMSVTEVLIHACIARRRTEGQVLVKDGLVPVLTAGLAIGFYYAGFDGALGLGLAHAAAMLVGAGATAGLYLHLYADVRADRRLLVPPPELVRAARPLWLADLLAATLNRLDVYMLAMLGDPLTAGLYQGALQIAINVLAVRSSFDSLVAVLVVEIQARGDRSRMVHGFSHALALVALIVLPLTAFILAFAAWILPILGAGFDDGAPAVWIMACMFTLHGTLGMSHGILVGSGRGLWITVDNVVALLAGALAYFLLLPRLGVTGAGIATGFTYVVLGGLYIVQARVILGYWPYDRKVAALFGLAGLAGVTMAALWLGLADRLGDAARVAGFLGFAAVFGPGAVALRRTGSADAPARV